MTWDFTAAASIRLLIALLLVGGLAGCEGGGSETEVTGRIHIDGSSTVYPITEAVVEEFQAAHRSIRVAVGVSGTGGGFKKFCSGEAEIADASRAIKASELERCRANGVEPVEFPIALDGLSVMVNPANDWADCLTVGELRRIWQPGSTITTWAEVRDGWPDEELVLYGPGIDSGSFDYFTENIVGEEDASRPDYMASEDDNVLVHGISGDRGSLGYFGHAYYVENADLLKLVAIDGGEGCVLPDSETVRDDSYRPLTRPLFIYVDRKELEREGIVMFMRYYFTNVARLASAVGYVPLPTEGYEATLSGIE
ncbi:MAG: phosphate ABC transporter substrate-binding protein PstS family protein [Gemmatimonadetes bacterium]|nr:phosphate ABC transporter substrate-binding protein PstS family protein [Gemmatimonadota bacterium]NIO30424.1 phosphate ABC transporter substrate-binding protein PstS family protein [Gemmatimonadota bacterium]